MRTPFLALFLTFLSIATAQAAYIRWANPERTIAAATDRLFDPNSPLLSFCSRPDFDSSTRGIIWLMVCARDE